MDLVGIVGIDDLDVVVVEIGVDLYGNFIG